MGKDRISVIVPIYNVEQYLVRCIESIVNQTYKNLEIILIDDGSPDNCGKICDEYSKMDKRIKVIHQINKGLAETRNVGIEAATSELIVFIDSDDYISLDMIEKLYTYMINENAQIAACGHIQIYDSGNRERNCKKDIHIVLDAETALSKFMFTHLVDVVSWNKLYKKSLFNGIKFPSGKLYEDHYTIYKLIDRAEKIVYNSEPLYYYCKRSTSIGGSAFSKRTFELKDALEEECNYIINKYPRIRRKVELAKNVWLMVIYNKMMLDNYKDENFEKYLKNGIRGIFPYFLINQDITFMKKAQLFLFTINSKLYKCLYYKYIKKHR